MSEIPKCKVCRHCGHPVGKLPRGLYVLRDDFEANIRIYSTGREWLHLVEYTDDRKIIGTMEMESIKEEITELEDELNGMKSVVTEKDFNDVMNRLQNLRAESNIMKETIETPERESRMYVEKCWGNHMHCTCRNPEPEVEGHL
jgi:hypothetical protein